MATAGDIVRERYELLEQLGRGGFGEVWKARELAVDRIVAIKFLNTGVDRAARLRFEREARALGRLNHHVCVQLFDFNFEPQTGEPYLVTEYVVGATLREWFVTDRTVSEIIDVGAQIASALDAAHREGVFHRDLKPANVLVSTGSDRALRVKVLDFGLAKIAGREPHDVTKAGEVFGTPGYMSPEQLRGLDQAGAPSDLYCLGVLLYEMLEQRPLFSGGSVIEISMQHLRVTPPPIVREIPDALRAIVSRLLEKTPEQRFGSARGVVNALNAIALPSAAEPTAEVVGVSRVWWGAVILALAAAVIGGVFFMSQRQPDPPKPPPPVELPRGVTQLAAPVVERRQPQVDPQQQGSVDETRRSTGCGKEHEPGFQRLPRVEVFSYLPESYDPEHAHALVVLLHDGEQEPQQAFEEADMTALADEHRFVMIAPEGGRRIVGIGLREEISHLPWAAKYKDKLDAAWFRITRIGHELCIDPQRIFVIGLGVGGRAAEQLVCYYSGMRSDAPEIRAISTSGHRFPASEDYCAPSPPVPYLLFAELRHPMFTRDGTPSACARKSTPYHAIEAQEDFLRENHRCGDEETAIEVEGSAKCKTWDCEVELEVCRVDGGADWPGYRAGKRDDQKCGGTFGRSSTTGRRSGSSSLRSNPPRISTDRSCI